MRILLLSPLPPPAGGIATWTSLFLNFNKVNGSIIDVINTSVVGARINNFIKKSIKDELYRTANIFSETKKHLKRYKYDVVHINTSCSKLGMIRDYLCIKIVKAFKIKLVIHCHCDTSFMVKGKFSELIFKKICRLADKIFCLNTSSQFHVKYLSAKESVIIPNFIDKQVIKNVDRIQISNQVKSIIYVGHIVKTKGCSDILTVAKQMPHIRFKLVGYLSDEIKAISASGNVEYLGEISKDEVLEQMLKSDILLFPSYTEGFPNVVLEAMASGLPIIATPVGAIPDMIEDKGGILVNIEDVTNIIDAINVLQDKGIRQRMSEWNRAKVNRCYTVDKVIKHIFNEYSTVK